MVSVLGEIVARTTQLAHRANIAAIHTLVQSSHWTGTAASPWQPDVPVHPGASWSVLELNYPDPRLPTQDTQLQALPVGTKPPEPSGYRHENEMQQNRKHRQDLQTVDDFRAPVQALKCRGRLLIASQGLIAVSVNCRHQALSAVHG